MKLYMKCNEQVASDLNDVSAQFENLSRIILEAAGADIERPTGSASFTLDENSCKVAAISLSSPRRSTG